MALAEKALIDQIRRLAARTKSRVVRTRIGDDCAVLQLSQGYGKTRGKSQDTLVTTDFSLEGIHFRRQWHQPESIAHRCLARGLSDIAAMGGEPVAAFLSLALPPRLPQSWVHRFTRSLLSLAEKYGVTLAGGDTAQSPNGILADIVIVGTVPKGRAILRSRSRPGDLIYVTGELGGSAAAIAQVLRKPNLKLKPQEYPRHFFPEPRIALGRFLREKRLVSAMIDTSDGLSTDLAHLCEESGVGAEIQAERIPRATVGKPHLKVDLQLALHGGEDYELLFTAARIKKIPQRIAGVSIALIGQMTRDRKIWLIDAVGSRIPLKAKGWEHFRS